jgi:TRAP-type transport system small permease protein
VIVVASVCWGVLTRYVTAQPATWSGEIAAIAFAWMVFLGAAAGFKYQMHISVDLLLVVLPAPWRRTAQALGDALVMLFIFYVIWLAVRFNLEALNVPTPVLRMPAAVLYASVLAGFAFMAVRYAQLIRHRLTGAAGPMFQLPVAGERRA